MTSTEYTSLLGRIDSLDKRIEELTKRIDALVDKTNTGFWRIMILISASGAGGAGMANLIQKIGG